MDNSNPAYATGTPRPLRHKHCALALAIQLVSAGAVVALPSLSVQAAPAQSTVETPNRISFNIPAGTLSETLNRFAEKAGIYLSGSGALTAGKASPGLQGEYSVNEGLQQLLQNSGLTYRVSNGNTVTLEAAENGVMALPAVRISANSTGARTEDTGSYTTGSMSTSTKLKLTPRETPQSVTVLTTQMIKDQNLVTLDDAINSIPGLVMRKGGLVGNSGTFAARGFDIDNMMIDGLPISLLPTGTLNGDNEDLAIYDRVEVVKGSAGLTTGSGNPSAAINLVRKRPTQEPAVSISGTVGSWDNYRLLFDGSNALNSDKTLRGRVVASTQDKDNFYDDVSESTQQAYGIAEYDLAPSTMLTLGASWRDQHTDGVYSAQPVNEDGSFLDVKRSANFGNDFDYWDQQTKDLFVELKHDFDNGWAAHLSAIKHWQDIDVTFSGFSRSSGILYQNTQRYVMERENTSLNINTSGPFTLFNREHELAIGGSYRHDVTDTIGGWADYSWTSSAPVVDVHNWDSDAVPKPDLDLHLWSWIFDTKQTGAYAVTRLNITDPLKLIIGSRVDRYKLHNDVTGVDFEPDTQITPYAGIVYDLNANYSAYASWTDIFQPQTAFDKNGEVLDPITGTNLEAGIKGEYLDGRLNASLAVFQILQQNRSVDDLSGPNPCPPYNLYGACQRASGEVEVNGVELEISGELAAGWQMMAGYTYVTNEYTKDDDPDNIGEPLDPQYPEHQFKLATSYHITDKWRIGGNIYYQSSTEAYWTDLISQGSYTVVGLSTGYQFNENLDAQLNINNVFDEKYYQNLGFINGGNQPGEPRSLSLTVKWRL